MDKPLLDSSRRAGIDLFRSVFAYDETVTASPQIEIPADISLRTELSVRGMRWAARQSFRYERTDGAVPGIVFARTETGHGNFHREAFAAISATPAWARRLTKVHTASRRVRARADWRWMELDCAVSSDALLMNVFCFPGVTDSPAVRALLGINKGVVPEFGVKPRTPLARGKHDNTEVDMRLGSLLVEAKLTESDFQTAKPSLVERYRDFDQVFDRDELPLGEGRVLGYQLIRGTLAAHASGGEFCVLSDARRPDMLEMWYRVIRAVRLFDLRCRLKLLTWQELATAVPHDLAEFLREKYGI